jgi:hypothetical protein
MVLAGSIVMPVLFGGVANLQFTHPVAGVDEDDPDQD